MLEGKVATGPFLPGYGRLPGTAVAVPPEYSWPPDTLDPRYYQ